MNRATALLGFALLGSIAYAIGWVYGGPTGGAIALVVFGLAMVGYQLENRGPK